MKKLLQERLQELAGIKPLYQNTITEQPGSGFDYTAWVAFINGKVSTHQNPCNFLGKRYVFQYDKLINNTDPNNPNHSAWITMLTQKLIWFSSWIQYSCAVQQDPGCCAVTINEQRQIPGKMNLESIPEEYLAVVDSNLIARAKADAEKSAAEYWASQGAGSLTEQGYYGGAANFNVNTWAVGQTVKLDGNVAFGVQPHPNPCKYLNNRVVAQSNKMANLGGGTGEPNTQQGIDHKNMLQQKIAWWEQEKINRNC